MIQYFDSENKIFLTKEFLHDKTMEETIRVITNEEGEEIDESFVSNVIEVGMIWELVCAVLSFVGGALLVMRQNYNLVLVGCAAAIVGLGGLLLSTLCGASALYFTFQSKPEFGINEQDESW